MLTGIVIEFPATRTNGGWQTLDSFNTDRRGVEVLLAHIMLRNSQASEKSDVFRITFGAERKDDDALTGEEVQASLDANW
jgi:hypothetical protein